MKVWITMVLVACWAMPYLQGAAVDDVEAAWTEHKVFLISFFIQFM
jgi:hypothetical protein